MIHMAKGIDLNFVSGLAFDLYKLSIFPSPLLFDTFISSIVANSLPLHFPSIGAHVDIMVKRGSTHRSFCGLVRVHWLGACLDKRLAEDILSTKVMASGSNYFDDIGDDVEFIEQPKGESMKDLSELGSDLTPHQPKPNKAVVSSVRELLECPVCLSSMYPPIHQCSNGHTLCSECKPRVHNRCPTCRHELGNIRCLALEKVAASLELPCKYQTYGCMGIFPYYCKSKHESQCTFRPYNCPYAGSECTIVGDIPYLVSHLKDDHKVDMHNGSTFNHRYVKSNPQEVENATWMLTVFSCFGQYFCLHFEAFKLGMAPVYIAFLRFMGNDSEAKHYSYSLEVGVNGRKMIWQGVPRSIRDCHKKVRDSYDGLIIQRSMALFFSGGDKKELKLRVTGRIWKEQ